MHGFDKGVIEGREHEEWKWDMEVACLGCHKCACCPRGCLEDELLLLVNEAISRCHSVLLFVVGCID